MPTSDKLMEVAEYVVVVPPVLVLSDPQSIMNFCRQVTLQVQGKPAIIDEQIANESLSLSLAVAYEVATRIVLRLEDGQMILIFDHETRNLVSEEKIDDSVWLEISKLKDDVVIVGDITLPPLEHVVDLAVVWNEIDESNNLIDRTKTFLRKIVENSEPAMTLKLRGEIPSLPLLAAVYLLRPFGHTIQYQNNVGEHATLFV